MLDIHSEVQQNLVLRQVSYGLKIKTSFGDIEVQFTKTENRFDFLSQFGN